jgi:hypothetical protein
MRRGRRPVKGQQAFRLLDFPVYSPLRLTGRKSALANGQLGLRSRRSTWACIRNFSYPAVLPIGRLPGAELPRHRR